ncbi:MAG TPA: hypothetical protein VFE47_01375, partial [Tepidisphaeraceae bacterium]|nr:hypothetical protein [Tepidisphaeraceae bacterium]
MTNDLTHSKSPRLAGLMKMTGVERTDWSPAELGAVLRHQLAAPLEYDLRTLAPGGERTINEMTASIAVGPRPRSFGDLVTHPRPPLDLLALMKDFARNGRDDGSLPAEVGTVLYYAAITLGLLRHNARITKLDDQSLEKGIEWASAVPWLDPNVKGL